MTITVRVRVRVRVRVEEKTRTPCDSQTKASSSLKMSLTCGKWLVSFSSSDSERDSELYEHSSELVVTPVQSSGVPGSDNCPSIHPSIHPSINQSDHLGFDDDDDDEQQLLNGFDRWHYHLGKTPLVHFMSTIGQTMVQQQHQQHWDDREDAAMELDK